MKRATVSQAASRLDEDISIHALVKRATEGKKKNAYGWIISIHALVKRATSSTFSIKKYCSNFNPRPREEGDSKFIQ